jgi:hypothetical protein
VAGGGSMKKFNIKVARIETVARPEQNTEVCITFKFERSPIAFQIPIFLKHKDFDDTEMIKAARNALHRIFLELANQCETWSLTSTELQGLVNLNVRPTRS